MFLDLLAQKAADLTRQFAFLVTPDDIKYATHSPGAKARELARLANTRAHACQSCCREADPQTLIHFNNTPTADPADTVNALGRHLEYVPQLLATSPRLIALTWEDFVVCLFQDANCTSCMVAEATASQWATAPCYP